MTVACLQLNSSGRIEDNSAMIEALAHEAAAGGAELLCLPENAYFMRGDDTIAPATYHMHDHPGLAHAQALAQELKIWLLIGSVFVALDDAYGEDLGKWANRSVLIDPAGQIVAHYDKIHLFDADFGDGEAYRESDQFLHGKQTTIAPTPFGQLGLTVCYDVRFPYLYRHLAKLGASAIMVPAAFAKRTGEAHWHVLLRARAIENGCYIIAPAQCGNHPLGRQTFGHSLIIDPWGTIIAEAETAPGVIMAEIRPEEVARIRGHMPVLTHDRDYVLQDYVI